MLRHVPFYAPLLEAGLANGKKPSASHVLMYGAIEAHSMGEKGCIASNATLAADIGISQGRAANLISELAQAAWIQIKLNGHNQRTQIIPTGRIFLGSEEWGGPEIKARADAIWAEEEKGGSRQSEGGGSRQSEGGVHARVKGGSRQSEHRTQLDHRKRKEPPTPKKPKTSDQALSVLLADGRAAAVVDALRELVEDRRDRRKPMTARAVLLASGTLERLHPGNTALQIASVTQSIANGWLGLFEVKSEFRPTATSSADLTDEHKDAIAKTEERRKATQERLHRNV